MTSRSVLASSKVELFAPDDNSTPSGAAPDSTVEQPRRQGGIFMYRFPCCGRLFSLLAADTTRQDAEPPQKDSSMDNP
jgi:hypothetical protein